VAAQLVQAAAAAGPDAAGRDAQPGADLRIRQRRIVDEQGEQCWQLGAAARTPSQRAAQFGREQVLLGRLSVVVGE
jgi:hypothetical protein